MSDVSITAAIKTADRITGTHLDTEIARLIAWARAELERLGIPHAIAVGTDALIENAVIQGALSQIARDDKIRDAAEKAFVYNCDCLKKHEWQLVEGVSNETTQTTTNGENPADEGTQTPGNEADPDNEAQTP